MGILFANENVTRALRMNDSFKEHSIITVPELYNVDKKITDHTDLGVFINKTIICEPTIYSRLRDCLMELNGENWTDKNLICGKSHLAPEYPNNIAYNALMMRNHFFHLLNATDNEILESIKAIQINVKQGYTRCSCLPVGDMAAITEDVSLANHLSNNGYKVLKIEPGHVDLPGYPYGFIGGSGGTVESSVVLNGSLSFHPDKNRIETFIEAQGYNIVELHGGRLVDCGSILYFTDKNEGASC